MFTTAGVTRVSIGASDGSGCPPIAAGKVAARLSAGTLPKAATATTSRPVSQGTRREGNGDMSPP